MKKNRKQIVTAATTFSAALGIGFVMQYTDAGAARLGESAPVGGPESRIVQDTIVTPVSASVATPAVLLTPEPTLPGRRVTTLAAAPAEEDAPRFDMTGEGTVLLARAEAPDAPLPPAVEPLPSGPETAPVAAAEPACETTLSAEAGPLAMVHLALENGCRPNTAVTIHHEGLMFTILTDAQGRADLEVPAFAAEAYFIAAYDDAAGAVAITEVPDLPLYDRAAVQWTGPLGVELHALEFGARYGEAGHVWAGAPAESERAALGQGGYFTTLGDADAPVPMLAEVYTYPSGSTRQDGTVGLSVEAEVTAANCGREIAATSIQVHPGGTPSEADLLMRLPGCDAIGEFLVLKNMFEDLTLAAR